MNDLKREVLDTLLELYRIDKLVLNFKKEIDLVYDKVNNLLSQYDLSNISRKPGKECHSEYFCKELPYSKECETCSAYYNEDELMWDY